MRTLLRFIQKYSNLLLFLLFETIAIAFMVEASGFQRSKIVGVNRQVSGYIFSKVDGAREYLSLKEVNQQLADENLDLRNKLDLVSGLVDSATVISEVRNSYHYFYVPSRIIHNSVFKQFNYNTQNKGKKHGGFR